MKVRWFIATAILLVIAVVSVSVFVHTQRGQAQPSLSQSGTSVVAIPIEGLVCSSCTARVKRALESIDGVTEVEVSLQHRQARVRYVETKVSPNTLVAAIDGLGYKAGTPAVEQER